MARSNADTSKVDTVQPWPGLDAFTEEQSTYFCGRDTETDELFRYVQRDVATVLFGQSGLGKTSLLQAGLFPRLRQTGFLPILIRLDYADGAPPAVDQVKTAINRACSAAKVSDASLDTTSQSLWGCFHRVGRRLTDAAGKELVPVLAFDQFEEIFTQGLARSETRPESQRFLTELAELIENRPPEILEQAIETDPEIVEGFQFDRRDYRIVVALRADLLAALEGLRRLSPSLGRGRYRLRRMTGTEGLDAILNPVPGLVDYDAAQEIIRFVGRANPEYAFGSTGASEAPESFEVEPSLLSLVCRELNERRMALKLETISADLLAGNRDKIIEEFYEQCFKDQAATVRAFVEDELLSTSGYRESITLDTAHRALSDKGAPATSLDELVRRRLLHVEERSEVARIEIIHDVLTPVIRRSRDTRQLREAEAKAADHVTALRRERRRVQFAYCTAAILALLAVFSIGLLWWGYNSKLEAERQRALAEKRTEEVADVQLLTAGSVLDSTALERVPNYAMKALRQYREKLTTLYNEELENPDRLRELSVTDFTLALLAIFTNTEDSVKYFENYRLDVARLVALKPTELSLEHDLAASHAVLGTAFEKRTTHGDENEQNNNLMQALNEYKISSEILHTLAASDAHNLALVRELAVSHAKIGSTYSKLGDLRMALHEWRIYETIMLPLAKGQHDYNSDWSSELTTFQDQIGDALQATGDLEAAVGEWRSYEATMRDRLKNKSRDHDNGSEFFQLAENYKKVGDSLSALRKYGEAIPFYENAIEMRQQLASGSSEDSREEENLVSALRDLSGAWAAVNRRDDALATFSRIRAIREKQVATIREKLAQAPGDTQQLSGLSASLGKLAHARQQVGDVGGALTAGEERLLIARRLYTGPWEKDDMVEALGDLSYSELLTRQPRYAATLAEEALKLDPDALSIKVNLANAYLLLGRFESAKSIYLMNKLKDVRKGISFTQAMRDKLAELRRNGINNREMNDIETLLH
jgi:tetratricopeptide (TPR) repeat protein